MVKPDNTKVWWQSGAIYQLYPRSFQDTNDDGIGDLPGIETRLGYLKDLGVDGVWISPFYPSPMVDFGYDITDQTDVDPVFGTLDDFDRLLKQAHDLGLKIILDFVPGHTSDQHSWFLNSRQGKDADKRDWYIWRDPAPDGGPPNNWQSEFGGPAWTFDRTSGQYYCHAHLREQPDLNWRNPEVVEAMLGIMETWFERGVDGFRIAAVDQIGKDAELKDNPPDPTWHEGRPSAERFLRTNQKNGALVHEAIAAMRQTAEKHGGKFLAGEAYLPFDGMAAYYGTPENGLGLHMPYNFHLIGAPWDPRQIAEIAEAYEAALPDGGWPNWVMGNHDRPRVASRWGRAEARLAALLQLTLRGTPTIYQGEELGMESVPIPPDLVQDPWEKNTPGHGLGRDPVRTPMAWDTEQGSGFTKGEPWLPIDDRPEMAVSQQVNDDGSMLSLYRAILQLRRQEPALSLGDYKRVYVDDKVFAFQRSLDGRKLAVALNFSKEAATLPMAGEVLLSTGLSSTVVEDALLPLEGRILLLAE